MMYYNFDTSDPNAATAALLVYAIYRSRDAKRFKVTPEMWNTIERSVKSVAKRAEDLGEFIEKLKPKLACASIKPKWAKTLPDDVITMKVDPATGELMQVQDQGRRQAAGITHGRQPGSAGKEKEKGEGRTGHPNAVYRRAPGCRRRDVPADPPAGYDRTRTGRLCVGLGRV
jgi:hypothetical protein